MERSKVGNALKWSSVTEIVCRLIQPITNMVLARILLPEVFGVVATVNVVFSFAEIFRDSGFQKYLIQHEFKNEEEKEKSINVAFWTNMIVALLIWGIISMFNKELAHWVGNDGKGILFVISCSALPITALSSIQMAIYKRELNYKVLFVVRVISSLVPFFVTIPLALIYKNYWSLIFGTLFGQMVTAVVLTIHSNWKPQLKYSASVLREMLSFSVWTMLDTISVWLSGNLGTFIVGLYLSSYYVGIYKTSINSVNQIMALITGATTPILFAVLSRNQTDRREFDNIFFGFQRKVGMLVIPLGVGIFVYRELLTTILLGEQWSDALDFIGIWGLMCSIKIVFSQYCSEAYRALGKPILSVIVQWLQIIVLIPVLLICAPLSFEALYWGRSLITIELIVVNLVVGKIFINMSPIRFVKNLMPFICAAVFMGLSGWVLESRSDNILYQFVTVLICIVIYFVILYVNPNTRKEIIIYYNKIIKRGTDNDLKKFS